MGLIAHYRLDGDVTDAVGDKHGSASSAVWTDGKLGQAADMRSTSWWITGDGWKINSDFSYSFWAIQTSDSDSDPRIGGLVGNHYHEGGPTGCCIYMASGTSSVRVATGDGVIRPAYILTVPYPTNEWQHYTVTYKGKTVSVYQNGVLVDSRERDIKFNPSRPFAIGRWASSYGNYYLNGMIDDVRIYDHALSPREVRDLSLGLAVHHAFQHDFYDAVRSERATPVGDVQLADIDGRRCAVINSSGKRLNIEPFSAPVATLTFWYKRDDAQSSNSWRTVLGCVANIAPAAFAQGSREFGLWDGSFKYSGYVSPNDGAFHFYTTVLQGDGTALFYVDGEYLTTISTTLSLVNNPIDRIGSWTSQYAYYAGIVGEVKLFATALTPSQVKELYRQRTSIDSEGSVHIPLIKEGGRGGVEFKGGNTSSLEADGDFLEASSVVEVFPEVERTLEFWVYPTKATSSNIIISLHTDDVIGDRTYIDDNNATGDFRFYARGSNQGTIKNAWEFDRWQHIALVFSSSGISAYRDGIEVGSTSATWDLGTISPSTLQIGRGYHGGGSRYFVGRMSDFRIWSKSLSQEEIVDVGSHRVLGNEPGLIVCWPMMEGEGDLVKDVVSGRDAVLHGGKWIVDGPSLSNSLDLLNISEVGVARGLVAWYPLIGDTLDYAGTNHAVNNGAVATAEGYEFNKDAGTNITFGPFSWESVEWSFSTVYKAHSMDTYHHLFTNAGGQALGAIKIYWDGPCLHRSTFGNKMFGVPVGSAFRHLAMTYDGSTLRTYIDGELTSSHVGDSIYLSPGYFLAGVGYGDEASHGIQRDVRIHNVALTPEEIAIQAKLALNHETKTAMTQSCLYTKGQIKEVIT